MERRANEAEINHSKLLRNQMMRRARRAQILATRTSAGTRRQNTMTTSLLSKLAKLVSPELLDIVVARGVAAHLNSTEAQ
jgi:hypothetical protein